MKKRIKLPALIKGKWKDKNGKEVSVDTAFMERVKKATEKFKYPGGLIPIVKGHPKEDTPAEGHVKNTSLVFDEKGQLAGFAEEDDCDPKFMEAIKNKNYNKVSVAIRRDGSIRHFGVFGAHPTAIGELDPISFAEEDDLVFQFGECEVNENGEEIEFTAASNLEISDWPFRSLRQLLRKLKNWLVETEGAEEAEKILPEWDLDNIGEPPRILERVPEEKLFSENQNKSEGEVMELTPELKAKLDKVDSLITENEELKKKLDTATTDLTDAQRKEKLNAAYAFCESDEMKNRIKPAIKNKVAHLLVELDTVPELQFSEGEGDEAKEVKVNAAETLKEILKGLPEFEFGEFAKGGDGENIDSDVKLGEEMAALVS